MSYIYPTIDDIVNLHDKVIAESGGLSGVRDLGVLESVLEHIQNDLYYPEFVDKLTHLIFSINKLHAFNDGNKRSSLSAGLYFITENGWSEPVLSMFVAEMESVVVDVADNRIGKDTLGDLISFIFATAYASKSELENIRTVLLSVLSELHVEAAYYKEAMEIFRDYGDTDGSVKMPELEKGMCTVNESLLSLEKMLSIINFLFK